MFVHYTCFEVLLILKPIFDTKPVKYVDPLNFGSWSQKTRAQSCIQDTDYSGFCKLVGAAGSVQTFVHLHRSFFTFICIMHQFLFTLLHILSGVSKIRKITVILTLTILIHIHKKCNFKSLRILIIQSIKKRTFRRLCFKKL